MTQPIQPDNIRGEPIELDILLSLAVVGIADIESAIEWWDEHASSEWVGALEAPFDEGNE